MASATETTALNLKPLCEQTIVITGASSGIGLATARAAADQGARVVLSARNEEALAEAAEAIRNAGGEAAYVSADVSIAMSWHMSPTSPSTDSAGSIPG